MKTAALLACLALAWPPLPFNRGDVNQDGEVTIDDATFIQQYLWFGGPAPVCLDSADVNDDGAIGLSDQVYLYDWLFLGGPDPAYPFGVCDDDPTADNLSCDFWSRFVCP